MNQVFWTRTGQLIHTYTPTSFGVQCIIVSAVLSFSLVSRSLGVELDWDHDVEGRGALTQSDLSAAAISPGKEDPIGTIGVCVRSGLYLGQRQQVKAPVCLVV